MDGFKKFGGQLLKFKIEEISNLNVYLASGDSYGKLTMKFSTADDTFKVGEWVEVSVEDRVYVAAVAKSHVNKLKLIFT